MAETDRIGSSTWTVPDARRWREADARGMVTALRASGEGIAEFARRHGLHEERVRRWDRRLQGQVRRAAPAMASRPAAAITFAPVRVLAAPAPATADAPLDVLVGGAVLRVHRGFDEALLRQVVSALGGGRC
jgi:transposase-like protein